MIVREGRGFAGHCNLSQGNLSVLDDFQKLLESAADIS